MPRVLERNSRDGRGDGGQGDAVVDGEGAVEADVDPRASGQRRVVRDVVVRDVVRVANVGAVGLDAGAARGRRASD